MSPSISSSRDGSTLGGRGESDVDLCLLLGLQVVSCVGVVELNTSWRHVHRLSHDSALNLLPLLNTRFSRHEIPDLD